jgi:hypothetical protein
MDLVPLAEEHRLWSTYVTGGAAEPPQPGRFYTADEISHMTDVRRLFDGAKILIPAGFFVMAIRLQRARAQSAEAMLRLARDGAIAAGVAVAALGLIAAIAFEQAFLFFHEVFFPQGNFLFDPTTSIWCGCTRTGTGRASHSASVCRSSRSPPWWRSRPPRDFGALAPLWRARSTRLATE